jgi:peptidoglycan/LPS O-acetylase OafA/YrhL
MLGCAVALFEAPRWFRHVAGPALIVMFGLTIVSPDQTHVDFLRFSLPAEAIATGVLLLALEQKPRLTPLLLRFPPLRRLGVISYSLYLYHPLIYPALGTRIHSHPVLVVTAFVVTIAAADLSYRFYESPIQRWGRARFHAESVKPPTTS